MSDTDTHLAPNVAEVAAKVMDGEAILINLANGMYYSMDGAGGFLWTLIERRLGIAAIADALHARYDVARHVAEADASAVVSQLVDAGLVLRETGRGAATGPVEPPAATRLPYTPPRLLAYDDMADLLALDPPHPSLTDTLSRNLVE